jgi:tRNA (guanine26-N2/guanine27-N2)-dimethyltransferase
MEAQSTAEGSVVQEGQANVFLPPSVFYNPVQEFNRDLSIAVISQHAQEQFDKRHKCQAQSNADENAHAIQLEAGKRYEDGISMCEALAASGLRSVRFGLEIPGVKEIIANDLDNSAVEYIKKNVAHNNISHLVTPSKKDASLLMYMHKSAPDRFDVIDLDPYGSVAPFLDAALQSVKDGGLICCTSTDAAVLCGNTGETCYAKYGAFSVRTKFCHEKALRILLPLNSCFST